MNVGLLVSVTENKLVKGVLYCIDIPVNFT